MKKSYDLDHKRKEKELKSLSDKNNTSNGSTSHWPKSILDSAIKSLKN